MSAFRGGVVLGMVGAVEMIDRCPAAHRIRTIRDAEGLLLGFGVTGPGGGKVVTQHANMQQALAKLDTITDFIYGPVRADRRLT